MAHQGSLSMGILQAKMLEWIVLSSSRGSSQPGDSTQIFRIASRFFTAWAPGKPKNTGVDILAFLQGIFPTQKLNQVDSLPAEYLGSPDTCIHISDSHCCMAEANTIL